MRNHFTYTVRAAGYVLSCAAVAHPLVASFLGGASDRVETPPSLLIGALGATASNSGPDPVIANPIEGAAYVVDRPQEQTRSRVIGWPRKPRAADLSESNSLH